MSEKKKPSLLLLVLGVSVIMWSLPSAFSGHFVYKPAGHHIWGAEARIIAAFLVFVGWWGVREYSGRLNYMIRHKGYVAIIIALLFGSLVTIALELVGIETYNALFILVPVYIVLGCIHSWLKGISK